MTDDSEEISPEEQAQRDRLRKAILAVEKTGGGCGQWLAYAERWAFELRDFEAAKRCLRQAEPMAIPGMYGDLASIWLEIGEPQIARPWIEKYELHFCNIQANQKDIETGFHKYKHFSRDIRADQLRTIYLIKRGQEKAAANYMVKAEAKAESAYDWLEFARLWHEIGEETARQRCMAAAEKLSSDCYGWLKCAETWLKFDDETRALRTMKKAEASAESTWDWSACAEFWKVREDTAALRRCAEGAEAIATAQPDAKEAVRDWWNCSRDWAELGDTVAALRCAEQAEARATNCWLWIDCARCWRTLGEPAAAKRCLETAERCDDCSWANIAPVWWSLGEKARARKSVTKAQAGAQEKEDISLMVVCAETWRMFDDKKKMRRCLELLEGWSGKNTSRWCYCAGTWRDFGFMDDARRCLKEAETVVENDGDLLRCGHAWRDLGDEAELEALFKRADMEELAPFVALPVPPGERRRKPR